MLRLPHTIGITHSRRTGASTSVEASPFALTVVVGLMVVALLFPKSAMGQDSVPSLIDRAQAAGADADLLRSVASRAEKAGLGPEQTAELLRPAVTLAERDLPTHPLLNKTLEGLAKRVPPGRMTPVLQQLQANTERAGTLVSTWLKRKDTNQLVGQSASSSARTQLITSVTEAQQQNVPVKTVEQFLDGLPGGVQRHSMPLSDVAAAVSVMPDLPGSASNPTVTNQLLTAALDAGYDRKSLQQLPVALERAQRETQRPPTAIAKGTARAISKGTPAARVLQNLFQGAMPGAGPPSGVGNGPPETPPGQGKPPGKGNVPPGVDPGERGPGNNPGQGEGNQSGSNRGGGT